jgi:hypothetical protein
MNVETLDAVKDMVDTPLYDKLPVGFDAYVPVCLELTKGSRGERQIA